MTELRFIARCALLLAGAAAGTNASAQVSPIAPSAAASAAAERAQRETDRTMYWIKVLAEKPAAKPAPAPAPRPVAAAPAPVPAPAAQNTRAAVAASDNRQAERMRLAAAAENSNAAQPPVVVGAAPAAARPAQPGANAGARMAKSATTALDGGLPPAGAAVALAAPAATAAPLDILPPEVDEPDPGLIMIKSADPQFPGAAMRRLRKGEVEVRFEVNADGMVDVVSVVKSSNSSLNSAALEAVRQWQFKPTPGHEHTASVALAFNMDN